MPKPDTIYLIRHGQSAGNADHNVYRITPDHAVPLTELGITQAKQAGAVLANKLSSFGVYVSPYLRTRQTLNNILSQIGNAPDFIREDDRLREQEYGGFRANISEEELEANLQIYGSYFYRIPNGESGADVADRQRAIIDRLFKDFEHASFPRQLLIVGHGFQIRTFIKCFFDLSHEEFEMLKNPWNCEIFQLNLTNSGKFELNSPFPLKSDVAC